MNYKEIVKTKEKRGLIEGYKPNRISLYIFLITCGRIEEAIKVMYRDMEEYKIERD